MHRIAYVDGTAASRVAKADDGKPQRLLRGEHTLPAWSDDGHAIAIAAPKHGEACGYAGPVVNWSNQTPSARRYTKRSPTEN